MKKNGKNEELQSRREFFKRAAKGALPILAGAALLSSPILSETANAMSCAGCNNRCMNSCFNTLKSYIYNSVAELRFTKNCRYYFQQQFEPYAPATFIRYQRPHNLSGKGIEYRRISGRPKGKIDINPHGRNMRCVWRIPYEPSKEAHYAMYPMRLVEIPIKAGCPESGIVLDPFMGSGTTAVVARRVGRKYIGFELNPDYIDICRKRLKQGNLFS